MSTIEMNHVHYYSVFSLTEAQSISALYQEKLQLLDDFSQKHKLQHFKRLSDDISVSLTSHIVGAAEVSLAITFESAFDASLLDKIRSELAPQSINFSRTQSNT